MTPLHFKKGGIAQGRQAGDRRCALCLAACLRRFRLSLRASCSGLSWTPVETLVVLDSCGGGEIDEINGEFIEMEVGDEVAGEGNEILVGDIVGCENIEVGDCADDEIGGVDDCGGDNVMFFLLNHSRNAAG